MPNQRQDLTDDQNNELEEMFNTIKEATDKINDWERSFIQDNYDRWLQWGKRTYLSEKQWETIYKIYQKAQEDDPAV